VVRQGSGPTASDLVFKERSDYENGSAGGERRVSEAREGSVSSLDFV
jgi:hypothetical protein